MPGPAAAIFAGTTKLDGGIAFADSGAFRIDRLELTSRTARLAAGGSLTRDRVADLTLQPAPCPRRATSPGPARPRSASSSSTAA